MSFEPSVSLRHKLRSRRPHFDAPLSQTRAYLPKRTKRNRLNPTTTTRHPAFGDASGRPMASPPLRAWLFSLLGLDAYGWREPFPLQMGLCALHRQLGSYDVSSCPEQLTTSFAMFPFFAFSSRYRPASYRLVLSLSLLSARLRT